MSKKLNRKEGCVSEPCVVHGRKPPRRMAIIPNALSLARSFSLRCNAFNRRFCSRRIRGTAGNRIAHPDRVEYQSGSGKDSNTSRRSISLQPSHIAYRRISSRSQQSSYPNSIGPTHKSTDAISNSPYFQFTTCLWEQLSRLSWQACSPLGQS